MNDIFITDGEYGKRGYLKENFRVFDIKDHCAQAFDFHYHDFDKIVFFKSGNVKYVIEGKEYQLKPQDILLVRHGDIHRPIIHNDCDYDRTIIWIDSRFLAVHKLDTCFEETQTRQMNLISLDDDKKEKIFSVLNQLVSEKDMLFNSALMKKSLLYQLMILLNRCSVSNDISPCYVSDKRIDDIMKYINKNLYNNLTIENIAKENYVSKYYLMHKFKEITGKTIYGYIQTKRLLKSLELLEAGAASKQACFDCGYQEYSVFLKAFKKEFGMTPTEYKSKYFDSRIQ
ncbi:MAG: AraC family transcriptional regulator [Clostridium sp.]|nr:AraC family transcriptional regulator [Clostridium sp.]